MEITMKKGVFIFLLLFCNLIYSQNFNTSVYFIEQIFEDLNITNDYIFIRLENSQPNSLIAHLAIFRGEGAILSYGTSGFILNVNNLSFQNRKKRKIKWKKDLSMPITRQRREFTPK